MGFALLYMLFMNKKRDKIYVEFSEVIGNKIVKHKTIYEATGSEKDDYINIGKLKLKRPYPPTSVMIPTSEGKKLVSIIKIDNNRFGYMIPTLDNSVIVPKRDEDGNIIKNEQGKPVLKKLAWTFTNNVIEPEVIHWAEAEQIKSAERHKIKLNMWDKFGGAITLGIIFLFCLMSLNMITQRIDKLTDDWIMQKDEMLEKAKSIEENAARTQDNLNNLIEKVTGTRVFDDEVKDREKYLNETKNK